MTTLGVLNFTFGVNISGSWQYCRVSSHSSVVYTRGPHDHLFELGYNAETQSNNNQDHNNWLENSQYACKKCKNSIESTNRLTSTSKSNLTYQSPGYGELFCGSKICSISEICLLAQATTTQRMTLLLLFSRFTRMLYLIRHPECILFIY